MTQSGFSKSLVNIDDLMKYFGFPAKNHEFSEFLLRMRINEHPAFDPETGNPFYMIQLPELGLSLEFIRPFAFIKKFGPIREDGGMVFSQIFAYLKSEDNYKAYVGSLPSALPDSLTPNACLAKFGKPSRIRGEDDEFGTAKNIEYTWDKVDGHSIFIRFVKSPLSVRHIVFALARL